MKSKLSQSKTVLLNSVPLQIFLAVLVGIAFGLLFPDQQISKFAEFGKMVIHWIKLIAGPFLFLTIILSVAEMRVSWNQGVRLVSIAVFNTAIAALIGITLAQLFLKDVTLPQISDAVTKPPDLSIGFSAWIKTLMPQSLLTPLVQNEILLMGLLALLIGIALRVTLENEKNGELKKLIRILELTRKIPALLLHWLIQIIPLAVLAVVAGSVSQFGLEIFKSLFTYVIIVLGGFTLQITLVYGTWIFVIAKMKFRTFWQAAKVPVFYAMGVNSSLATLPMTLKALKELKVSPLSASLGAGVATNLNNDGIVLYEAMAVFFIMHLHQMPLTGPEMSVAILTCIVASMGITGIPEAGFISLSVVVSTLGLPAELLPLLLSVDWIVARGRSVVNVLSDMTLSIALDATEKQKKLIS